MSADGQTLSVIEDVTRRGLPSRLCSIVGDKGAGRTSCLCSIENSLLSRGALQTDMRSLLRKDLFTAEDDQLQLVKIHYYSCVDINPQNKDWNPVNTVFFLDDLELTIFLLQVNQKEREFYSLIHSIMNSVKCVIVCTMMSADALPGRIRQLRTPFVFSLPPFTRAAAVRLLRSASDEKKDFTFLEEKMGETGVSSKSLFLSNACCATAIKSLQAYPSVKKIDSDFIVRSVPEGAEKYVAPVLFGLDSITSRLKTLTQAFVLKGATNTKGSRLVDSVSTTGILLHGPSGCGKTELTRVLQSLFPALRFYYVNCSGMFSKYLGESEQNLRAVYSRARETAPAVVVLDEVEVIATARGGGNGSDTTKGSVDVSRRMLAGLLCELDGVVDNSSVLTVCTTNAIEQIDKAMLRQGRLETVIPVPLLTQETAKQMALLFLEKFHLSVEERDTFSAYLATSFVGRSPAQLKGLFRRILESVLHLSSSLDELKTSDTLLPPPCFSSIKEMTQNIICTV